MRRWLALALICCAVVPAGLARAADQVLSFQAVTHTSEVHALPAPGEAAHQFGIAAFRGLAIFDDGRIAQHRYGGHFDFTDGAGRFAGSALWRFEDGSELRAGYAGEATASQDGGIAFTATYGEVTGTGGYAGVRGEGGFAGRRIDLLEDGGDTYFRGTLTLRPAAR